MAEHEKAPDAIDDLKYFGFILLVLGFLWLAGGGYAKSKQQRATPTPIPSSTPKARLIQVKVTQSTPFPTRPTPYATPGSDVYIVQ